MPTVERIVSQWNDQAGGMTASVEAPQMAGSVKSHGIADSVQQEHN